MFVFMLVGALFSFLAFRVFQPYAFSGLGLNPKWLSNIQEQHADASPNAGLLWNLQWARRTHLYSFDNLTVWGLGLPLGILAWAGFLWMGWRMLKGEWRKHILLWSWTAVYFVWQSLQYNPNMRYQLPIYPLLAMMAAWVVFDWARPRLSGLKRLNWRTILAATVGVRGSGIDLRMGICLQPHLPPAGDACGCLALDLSKCARPDRLADSNLGWYHLPAALAFSGWQRYPGKFSLPNGFYCAGRWGIESNPAAACNQPYPAGHLPAKSIRSTTGWIRVHAGHPHYSEQRPKRLRKD